MMLRTLFDERRRAEIRDALKTGSRVHFRKRIGNESGLHVNDKMSHLYRTLHKEVVKDTKRYFVEKMGEKGCEAFLRATGKSIDEASAEEITDFIYGKKPPGGEKLPAPG